jgi:hypothetical protein
MPGGFPVLFLIRPLHISMPVDIPEKIRKNKIHSEKITCF